MLSPTTYEDLKQAVANMYVDYGITSIPINVFQLADKIGLIVIPYSTLAETQRIKAMEYSSDGFSVETNSNKWIIYYNDVVKTSTRINQTIMHEIAHYILGHIKEGAEEEEEARFFAKYALVSPVLIKSMLTKITVKNIMRCFSIGYQAAFYAMDNYMKRKKYGPVTCVKYEIQILKQVRFSTEL